MTFHGIWKRLQIQICFQISCADMPTARHTDFKPRYVKMTHFQILTAKFRTLGQEKKKYIQRKLNLTTSTHHLGIICAKQGENQVISVLKSHAI